MTRHYRHMDVSYIEADNYQGGYDATEYLIKLGHRHIGLVTKPQGFWPPCRTASRVFAMP